ncbi:MAG: hypothetical protein KJP17_12180 [Gammaproteobacteria bacterium]|nr:hypothetical protein [Gammaproteobacteria bacterium]
MGVFRSAEIRWFFEGEGNVAIEQRLLQSQLAERQPARVDEYLLLPGCTSTGVKTREGRLEIKSQTRPSELQRYSERVTGYRDSWIKWSRAIPGTAGLPGCSDDDERWLPVKKRRALRLYSLEGAQPVETAPGGPLLGAGCQVEYSQIEVSAGGAHAAAAWWSFSLEAFGQPGSAEDNLDATAHHIFAGEFEFSLPAKASMSYPTWLQRVANL